MPAFRVIARLDIKSGHVVKGRQMDGVRKIGDPAVLAQRYADGGADEIAVVDIVASLYGRAADLATIERATAAVFVPVTVIGGLRSVEDMKQAMRAGADKVGINTAAVVRPALISEAATEFGSQAVVVSIDAKKRGDGYEAFTDGGREATGKDAVAWAQEAQALGAGEILVTSVDADGTMGGLDLDLAERMGAAVSIPLVVSGGFARVDDGASAGRIVDAVAIGAALHGGSMTITDVKRRLMESGARVRP